MLWLHHQVYKALLAAKDGKVRSLVVLRIRMHEVAGNCSDLVSRYRAVKVRARYMAYLLVSTCCFRLTSCDLSL